MTTDASVIVSPGWIFGLALWLSPGLGAAAQVVDATVVREERLYNISLTMQIDAPPVAVAKLIADYRNLATLSPSTEVSRLVAPGTGLNSTASPVVHVVFRPCVLMFCRKLTKVSSIEKLSQNTTRYVALPALSSFEKAIETLQITALASGTRLVYTAAVVPGFYVPGFMGAWLVRRVIVRDMMLAAERAESILKN